MNNTVTFDSGARPGCLVQLLWFGFVGWWFGAAWVVVAWFLMVTLIGAPVGAAMLNSVPQVMALRGRRLVQVDAAGRVRGAAELPWILRALYFVLVGWWLSAVWLTVAYALCMSIIGLPFGFLMFDMTPAIVSLKRV